MPSPRSTTCNITSATTHKTKTTVPKVPKMSEKDEVGETSTPVPDDKEGDAPSNKASNTRRRSSAGEDAADPAAANDEEASPSSGLKQTSSSETRSSAPSQTGAYPEEDQAAAAAFQHVVMSPQPTMVGQYMNYPHSPTVTAPAPGGLRRYDMHAMLMQQAMAGSPFAGAQYSPAAIPMLPPLSPPQPTTAGGAGNENAAAAAAGSSAAQQHALAQSPLVSPQAYLPGNPFVDQLERDNSSGGGGIGVPLSPAPPQAVPNSPITAGFPGIYQGANQNFPDGSKWADRSQQDQASAVFSDQYQSQFSLPRSESNQSSHSDELLLPPAASFGHPDPAYSPYAARQNINFGGGGPGGGTLFAHQHSWGYNAPGREGFGSPHHFSGPQHQQQQQHHYGSGQNQQGGYQGRHGGPQQQQMGGGPGGHHHPPGSPHYGTVATPGPPIQTTPSNKGPDGANLFIFHIPNHFTNLDMYNLFCPYGNLLSVRIMVERDTGRSRGFGFVSYDSPESAAMAIKDLNGLAIGNKRLKVQHKQIRPSDHGGGQQHQHDQSYNAPPDRRGVGHGGARDGSSSGGPVLNWHGGPQAAAGLEQPGDSPAGGGSGGGGGASPQEGVRGATRNKPPFHPAKEGTGAGVAANAENKRQEQPPPGGETQSAVLLSPDEICRPSLPPAPPLTQESANKVLGGHPAPTSAPSPLGHFESIRSALPDVAKETF